MQNRMKVAAVVLPYLFLSTACTTSNTPSMGMTGGDEIVLSVEKTRIAGGCDIEVFMTYPSDLEPQGRYVSVDDTSNFVPPNGGAVTLPRPASDPRPVDNGDGTTSFRIFQFGYSPCQQVPLEIEIGDCRQGACLPMRMAAAPPPDGVTVEVIQ